MIRSRVPYIPLMVVGLLLGPAPAPAVELAIGIPPGGVGAAMHVARDEIDLVDGEQEVDTRLTRVGLMLSESYTERLSMGLLFGYAWARQDGQPLTDGMRLSGNYAGINLHLEVPLAERLRAGLTGQVLYHWINERVDNQRVRLEWLQAETALTLQADLTPQFTLYTGALYAWHDVDQQARGVVSGSRSFEVDDNGGVVVGLLYEVDYRGWIGLEVRNGVHDGVALSFQRRF